MSPVVTNQPCMPITICRQASHDTMSAREIQMIRVSIMSDSEPEILMILVLLVCLKFVRDSSPSSLS